MLPAFCLGKTGVAQVLLFFLLAEVYQNHRWLGAACFFFSNKSRKFCVLNPFPPICSWSATFCLFQHYQIPWNNLLISGIDFFFLHNLSKPCSDHHFMPLLSSVEPNIWHNSSKSHEVWMRYQDQLLLLATTYASYNSAWRLQSLPETLVAWRDIVFEGKYTAVMVCGRSKALSIINNIFKNVLPLAIDFCCLDKMIKEPILKI